MTTLTAGEECQLAAKTLSAFADPRQGAISSPFINSAMGIAIFKGDQGVAVVRLKTGAQDTVLLFMTEVSIFSLVGQKEFVFNQTHRFAPGPLYGSALNLDPSVDVYCYVRFNGGFTPSDLISQHMVGWSVQEDKERHAKWHGQNATWFDVLTNKISVDRSSVGNALYLVLNLAATGTTATGKNFASIDEWSYRSSMSLPRTTQTQRPAVVSSASLPRQSSNGNLQLNNYSNFDAQALYQMQLKQQEQQMLQMQQLQGYPMMQNYQYPRPNPQVMNYPQNPYPPLQNQQLPPNNQYYGQYYQN
ncbi:hypothetical protein HK103_003002 [Boothiomyces macroporosus]|uniref:Uncharacterized protein n=1 Tax=Boothiomyces macroporosus TaxID=261099 RepID=A0AAD5UKV2_9FUNG|nr:hypothetical protein HK103_003002 [Boothiomyces macroporosus]